MLKLYTCYCCSFPFKADDGMLPCECRPVAHRPIIFWESRIMSRK